MRSSCTQPASCAAIPATGALTPAASTPADSGDEAQAGAAGAEDDMNFKAAERKYKMRGSR